MTLTSLKTQANTFRDPVSGSTREVQQDFDNLMTTIDKEFE